VDELRLGQWGSGATVVKVGKVHIRQITVVGWDIEGAELRGGVWVLEVHLHNFWRGGPGGGDVRDIGERVD
jgi:hypothetical protein